MRVRAHLDGAGRYWQVRVSTPVDLSGPVPGQWELPGFEVGQGDLFDAVEAQPCAPAGDAKVIGINKARGMTEG